MPVANGVPRESVSAAVAVSSTGHRSKQSEYIAIHEPVPRLTLTESVYQTNQGWQDQTTEAHDLTLWTVRCMSVPAPG
jgi:hypothetical protein